MSVIKHGEVTISFQHTGFIERVGIKTGPNGVAVLRALLDHANLKTRECRLSIATICARTALSESSVQRAIRALSEHGFVVISKRLAESGRQLSNSYTVMDRKLVESNGPKLMIRALKSYSRRCPETDSPSFSPAAGGVTLPPLELNVVESKALDVKGSRPSGSNAFTSSSAATASGSNDRDPQGAGANGDDHGEEAKPTKRSAFKRTARGFWIPVEPVFCQQRRNTNGAKAKTTATSKAQATAKTTATSTASTPPPPKPPAPRAAGRAAAGAGALSVADPTPDTPAPSEAPQRPRQRAPRPSDKFFNLFGELVLKGAVVARHRGLAGEFATNCVHGQVTEKALRDWRAYLDHTGDAKFLRPYNAWVMFAPWWEKRIGKYIQTPGRPSDLERFGGAGSSERWAHIRYGIPAEQ